MNIKISFSCQLLEQSSLIQAILTSMIDSSRSFLINQEKCGCSDHETVYDKLRMMGNANEGDILFKLKLWLDDDVITPSILAIDAFNVVILG